MTTSPRAGVLAAVFLAASAASATAQPTFEIGSSLAGAIVGVGDDNDGTAIGLPAAGFGIINPGVYASLFLGSRVAIEPQIGLLYFSSDGDSEHILNLAAQVDLFLSGLDRPSLYLFGSVGAIDTSGDGTTPKTVGGGVGYRIPVGDHLAFRLDGRFVHLTEDAGDQVAITLSIGGAFGR